VCVSLQAAAASCSKERELERERKSGSPRAKTCFQRRFEEEHKYAQKKSKEKNKKQAKRINRQSSQTMRLN